MYEAHYGISAEKIEKYENPNCNVNENVLLVALLYSNYWLARSDFISSRNLDIASSGLTETGRMFHIIASMISLLRSLLKTLCINHYNTFTQ